MQLAALAVGQAIEPKLDGWRVIVEVSDPVRALTRPGRDARESLPELASLVDAVPTLADAVQRIVDETANATTSSQLQLRPPKANVKTRGQWNAS